MFRTLALAAVAAVSVGAASAGPVSYFTLNGEAPVETFSGNDTNQIDDVFTLLGQTGWELADKSDDTNTYLPGVMVGDFDGKQGAFSVLGVDPAKTYAVTLKAGNGFAAWLLDLDTLVNVWTSTKDLSHASLYVVDGGAGGGDVAPVPLPAGAWLLGAALLGLGGYRRLTR